MKYHFIINPNAKSKGGKNIYQSIKPALAKWDVDAEVHLTEKKGDATEIAMMLTQNPVEKVIIVAGGDGTINEVVNGLVDYSNVKLGILPSGTGNDFARGLGLNKNPIKQLKSILKEKEEIKLDIGQTEIGDKDQPDYEIHRFVVSSGVGYDARICEITNKSKAKKIFNLLKLGKITYTFHGILQMINCKYGDVEIELDDGTDVYLKDFIFCSAHNLPFEGGGYLFAPKAVPTDGYLDLCVVNNVSRLKALILLPKSNKGKHIGHEGVSTYRCKSVTIKAKKRLPIHTDGETYERQNRIKISCLSEKISILK